MYIARLYYNTGFDPVNLPDSPDLLDSLGFEYKDVPAMDILQRYNMSAFKIKATEEEVIEADYLKVYEAGGKYAFYTIDGYQMTSADVATLAVTLDPICSARGVANINITGGLVVRCCEETKATPEQGDDLLVPSETLKFTLFKDGDQNVFFNNDAGDTQWYIESRVDVGVYESEIFNGSIIIPDSTSGEPVLAHYPTITNESDNIIKNTNYAEGSTSQGQFNMTAGLYDANEVSILTMDEPNVGVSAYAYQEGDEVKFTKSATEHADAQQANVYNTIVQTGQRIPKVKVVQQPTQFFATIPGSEQGSQPALTSNYTAIYDGSNERFKKALENMNSLIGADGILSSYSVPTVYLNNTPTGDTHGKIAALGGRNIRNVISLDIEHTDPMTAYIKKLPTYNKITMTAIGSGNSISIESGDAYDTGNFIIGAMADVRPGGRPYFYLLCQNTTEYNSIPGAEWKEIPIRFAGYSGSLGDKVGIMNSAYKDYANALSNSFVDAMGDGDILFSGLSGLTGSLGSSRVNNAQDYGFQGSSSVDTMSMGASLSNVMSAAMTQVQRNIDWDALSKGMYDTSSATWSAAQREQMKRNYATQNEIAALDIKSSITLPPYPVNTSPRLADLYGNGVIVGQYSVSSNDVDKFKKIIRRWGYNVGSVPYTSDFVLFNNNPDCDYVKMSGALVDMEGVPRSVRLSIAGLLNNGVRIWHTKPVPVR